ncbi:unnamed protein product [Clonostachys rhizophaga]|uniref:Arginase n=1 Tax=Clonostachys rhizophaga TaxID=160324 RepID=A0A9N9VRQ2_9HYPO|nr:unnamed protein product [Clonostachys rhizophaga]
MFEIVRRVSDTVYKVVKNEPFPLVLSGNCYASAAIMAGSNKARLEQTTLSPRPGVLWLDSHDDLDAPSTHENSYLDAVAASMMTGTSWHTLMKTVPGHEPVDVKQVHYCGLRDVSEIQAKAVKDAGMDAVWGKADAKVDFTASLSQIPDRPSDATHAYTHLDLDVLDESLGRVNEFRSPGGYLPQDLLSLMQMIPLRVNSASLVV